jgi:BirA family biotin operon repressor/biotin-[acetyl-CoA-carboxylase] ligase
MVDYHGLNIQRVCGRGYRWLDPINWLDPVEISDRLGKYQDCFNIIVLDSVDSTNKFLLDKINVPKFSSQKYPVVVAELQTCGQGRRGRRWCSGLGDSLTFSLLWSFRYRQTNLFSGLSLMVGVAIIRTLNSIGVEGVTLKWPNDVLFRFRKLAGVLIESSCKIYNGTSVVIGIGINIQLSAFLKSSINQNVDDLFGISGITINRNLLLSCLLFELYRMLKQFDCYGFECFREEWIRYHAYEGRAVTLTLPDGTFCQGVVNGIESDGALKIINSKGICCSFVGGEFTLREAC